MTEGRWRRGRRPTSTELDLWRRVAQTAKPLDEQATASPELARPVEAPASEGKPTPALQRAAKRTEAPTLAPSPSPSEPKTNVVRRPRYIGKLSPNAPGIDGNTARRLKQGRLEPDARIDLHGMTADRAHRALNQFVLSSFAMGRRFVLVITGKGTRRRDADDYPMRDYGDGIGVLRALTPEWLATPPLSQVVVGVFQAHIRHGGDGAYYVYLRKSPKGRSR